GYVELIIQPLVPDLSKIRLNCRQLTIRKILVNKIQAQYNLTDPVASVLPTNKTVNNHNEFKQEFFNALQEADEGELIINIPEEIKIKKVITNNKETTENNKDENSQEKYYPIIVRIEYELVDPTSGVYFNMPDLEAAPYRYPHMYTYNQCGFTRLWLPCIDKLQERCTWEMEYIVAKTVRPQMLDNSSYVDDDEDDDEAELTVVSSGELVEQIIHPLDSSKKIFYYTLNVPSSAPNIYFTVGPYKMRKLIGWQNNKNNNTDDNDEDEILSNSISGIGGGYIFYLPGRKEEAEYTTNFIQQAFSFYVQYIGTPYPYLSFKLVCLENPVNPLILGTTISFMSTLYLVTNDIIDQTYETRKNISRSLIMQWFGSYIVQKTWADTWLIHGLSHYIAGLFLKRHFGNNEYRYRLRKDIDYLVKLDVNQPPLHPIIVSSEDNQTLIPDPLILLHYHPDDDYLSSRSEFLSLKSPLVLYMLNKRIGKGILQKVITRITSTFEQGEMPFGLSTHHFLKLCRKLSKDVDLKEFADQWIYGTGIPKFYFTHHFNRKRMTVEFKFRQESTSNWGKKIKFTGPLTIRVHEPSGVFDTEVQVSEIQQNFDVQYHTKYKRIRSTKSKKKRKTKKNMEEDELEDEEESDENEEVNWGEGTDRSPVEWIRMDPDTEWLTLIILEQTHFMWGNQLQKDKDVIAQHHAISELKYHNIPEEAVSAVVITLEKAMLDCSNYYKIRMEASKTIVYCSAVQGIEKLMKAYKEQFCYPYHESTNAYIPYSNDFSNLSEYFVQKTIPAGMIGARDEHDLAFYEVRKFILDLLKNNDNTDNQYSDCYLIASLITSIGLAFVPTKKTVAKPKITIETNEVKNQIDEEEIERYRIRDMIMPSYHNIVTVKCLETYHLWMMAELIPVNYKIFLPYTRYGTCLFIRVVAIDALIILNGLFIDSICKYIFYLLRDDPSPYFRFHIAKSLVAYISLLGGITESDVEKKSQILENSTNIINQKPKYNQNELLKKYRIEFAENKFVREFIWDLLNNNPVLDHRIRMKLLNLCEILYIPIIPEVPSASQKGSLMKLKIRITKSQSTASIINNTTDVYNANTSSPENYKNVEKNPPVVVPTINSEQTSNKSVNNYKNDMKMCKKIIGKLLRHYDSSFFREPVDPVLFNIPTYFTIIKNPMDFGTVKKKLENKEYSNKCEFECDVRLVFSNCFLFNPPSTQVNDAGKVVENYFNKEWIEANGDTVMGKDELKLCNKIISKLQKHKSATAFLLPVDRNLYPQYYELIRKPMDLNLMKLKEKQLMKANTNENLLNEESDTGIKKNKVNENVTNEKTVKIKANMSPEPMEHSKTIIYLKNNNSTISEESSKVNSSKLKKTSVYDSEREYNREKSQRLKEGEEKNESINHVENKVRLNNIRSTNNTNEISAKRVKKDNGGHENVKENKAVVNNEVKATSDTETKEQNTFIPGSREYHKCQVITRKMQKHKYGVPFLEPVDPVALNIPTYFTIIKHPMDLSTIDSNLSKKKYTNIIGYYKDVDLMFRNCFRFNLPEEYVYQAGKSLQAFFEKEWINAASSVTAKSISSSIKNQLLTIIQKMQNHPCSQIFLEPVDPQQFPDYHKFIHNPMDLSTIKKNLEKNKYQTIEDFKSDISLIFSNCIIYNPPGSWAREQGQKLEDYW
ncbi:hypothetical protein PIROE2DRAFT_29498, partial [Piromyces sp. E2]